MSNSFKGDLKIIFLFLKRLIIFYTLGIFSAENFVSEFETFNEHEQNCIKPHKLDRNTSDNYHVKLSSLCQLRESIV